MKIRTENWRGEKVTLTLEEACTPVASTDYGGRFESVDAKADKNAEVLGKLIAHLVKRGIVTLDDAQNIIDNYDNWVPVED